MRTPLLILALAVLLAACNDDERPPAQQIPPDVIRVDHILIAVEGAPRLPADRVDPFVDAKAKAYDLLAKLKNGADWDALKKEHSDDGPPARPPGGPYYLANSHVTERYRGVTPRANMVRGFSDAAFKLDVGEYGMAPYNTKDSPFGFHILKREPLGPPHITVDHILISVKGPRTPKGDTDEVARKKAYDLLAQLKAGANFKELKKANTDDPPPGGPYPMANHGTQPTSDSEFPRGNMAPAFGDVGFELKVGELGMADYDQQKSPFGYHIIKRVR